MKNKLFLLLLSIPLFVSTTMNDDWKKKVDPGVLESAERGELVEYMVFLKEQADVSKADLFRHKEDKGNYVFQQLTAVSEQSQEPLLEAIQLFEAEHKSFWIVNALWVESKLDLIKVIADMPAVKAILPNPKVSHSGPVNPSQTADLRGPLGIEWGISQIGADVVWGMGYNGQNVVVGGQDTGVDWIHAAIQSQYKGWNGSSADHNYHWHDAIHSAPGNPCGTNTVVPCDDNSHGTHTIGTMVGDDGGSNQIGVAPGAKWIACRNMDEGDGTPATYIECFEWFLAPTDLTGSNPNPSKAPHVINNSWGCPPSEGCNAGNFATMEISVNNLRSAGVVVVVSAGNSGSSCSSVDDPAAIFDGSFSVGATDNRDIITGFSSRGHVTVDGSNRIKPNISAPGRGVRSCVVNGGYSTWQGTSMAGPHVAGVVALMISADPTLSGDVNQIENIIESTAVARTTSQSCNNVPGTSIPNNTYGHGRIDALAAVLAVTALPVELTEFYALPKTNSIDLHWTTSSEVNSDRFVIERSRNLENWSDIGQVPAKQFSDQVQRYAFVDHAPFKGGNYYRLRQIDQNTAVEYSKVVTARLDGKRPTVRAFPNPLTNQFTLQLSNLVKATYELAVFNAVGQQLYHQSLNNVSEKIERINSSDWAKGIYFLVVRDEYGRVIGQERLVKK